MIFQAFFEHYRRQRSACNKARFSAGYAIKSTRLPYSPWTARQAIASKLSMLFLKAVIYKAQVKIKVGLSGIGVEIEIGIEIEPVQRRRAF